jgi:hypothetical protein
MCDVGVQRCDHVDGSPDSVSNNDAVGEPQLRGHVADIAVGTDFVVRRTVWGAAWVDSGTRVPRLD